MNDGILRCGQCGAPRAAGQRACPYCNALFVPDAATAAPAAGAWPPGVVEAIDGGNLIEAIRLYRNAHKSSLLDAKNAMEALARTRGKRS